VRQNSELAGKYAWGFRWREKYLKHIHPGRRLEYLAARKPSGSPYAEAPILLREDKLI
jgi:hypothetical protein